MKFIELDSRFQGKVLVDVDSISAIHESLEDVCVTKPEYKTIVSVFGNPRLEQISDGVYKQVSIGCWISFKSGNGAEVKNTLAEIKELLK